MKHIALLLSFLFLLLYASCSFDDGTIATEIGNGNKVKGFIKYNASVSTTDTEKFEAENVPFIFTDIADKVYLAFFKKEIDSDTCPEVKKVEILVDKVLESLMINYYIYDKSVSCLDGKAPAAIGTYQKELDIKDSPEVEKYLYDDSIHIILNDVKDGDFNLNYLEWSINSPASLVDVMLSSTEWTPTFFEALRNPGYSIHEDGNKPKTLPWTNLNQLKIFFNEHVNIQEEDLSIYGTYVSEYSFIAFDYDPISFIATWTLQDNIDTDSLQLFLASSFLRRVGLGNFVDMGVPGLGLSVNVIPGDTDYNGTVNELDVDHVRRNGNLLFGDSEYSVYNDVDGNAEIRSSDVIKVRREVKRSITSISYSSLLDPDITDTYTSESADYAISSLQIDGSYLLLFYLNETNDIRCPRTLKFMITTNPDPDIDEIDIIYNFYDKNATCEDRKAKDPISTLTKTIASADMAIYSITDVNNIHIKLENILGDTNQIDSFEWKTIPIE